MQLSSSKVIQDGIVTSADGSNLIVAEYEGKSSIDLTVREIITKGDKGQIEKFTEYQLDSKESACVISNEFVHVPKGYVAYVFLKNSFSQKGLLAFNTGIIDGGYSGPVSTIITNSSLFPIKLGGGDERYFFRIVFHEIGFEDNEVNKVKERKYLYHDYCKKRELEMQRLPKHYLDPLGLKEEINKELKDTLINLKPAKFGIILGLVSLFLVIIPPISQLVTDTIKFNQSEELLKLSNKVKKLEAKLSQVPDAANTPPDNSVASRKKSEKSK